MRIPFWFMLLLTIGLAAEAAVEDANSLRYECYQGSIKLCDDLRFYLGHGIPLGFGTLFFWVIFSLWIILDKKGMIV